MTPNVTSESGPLGSVLFLSSNFPPETNALANRTWEHAREWIAEGGEVEVMTGPPHFPEGRIYEGFANRLTHDNVEGVDVLRVPMYMAANTGVLRRTLSHVSYMISAARYARQVRRDPGVVVASSPQFFAGLAGWFVSRRLKRPFVLEIRDLWPESIVDVGAMQRSLVIRAVERIETFLYRSADHVVIVSPAFRAHIEARSVPSKKITVLPNGVDIEGFQLPLCSAELEALRADLGLKGRFVASYIGTVGMAHGIGVILEAARRCRDPQIVFLVVGAGAEWQSFHDAAKREGLGNLVVIGRQPRERVRYLYALSDVSIVHLKDRPAFRKVIPSKMFESMIMQRPIVLGVRGHAQEILQEAAAGVSVTPGDPDELLEGVLRLRHDPALRERLGAAGAAHVREHHDRRAIARRYWALLQDVASGA